ncbi:hypothetical protein TanjilG_24511 [Lupinus angustifolius]|uniref:WW domain-containing protein n=1 Tax=Lupinus angustifolius TaxID=3871 RepID=A0A394D896_LUPAN|nr:hypothetical protein TanjilG_24511 [Lupinus angustifolius]
MANTTISTLFPFLSTLTNITITSKTITTTKLFHLSAILFHIFYFHQQISQPKPNHSRSHIYDSYSQSWKEYLNFHGMKYFYNNMTNEYTWEIPHPTLFSPPPS